jgi:hypothetical protein
VLLLAYFASVAATVVVSQHSSSSETRNDPFGRIVIDGPPACPMYELHEESNSAYTSAGGCFFVG